MRRIVSIEVPPAISGSMGVSIPEQRGQHQDHLRHSTELVPIDWTAHLRAAQSQVDELGQEAN